MVSSYAGRKASFAIFCIGLLIAGAFIGFAETRSRVSAASTGSSVGVIIPLYTDPGASWTEVIQAKQNYPSVPIIAIINPNSGPGNSQQSDYVSGITNLENAGVTVIGYVATGYGTSSYSKVSNVEDQINDYQLWYPNIQGIFFDEMSNSATEQGYYQTLANYANSHGMQVTAGNPGTTVDTALIGIFSNLCIYENPGMPTTGDIDQYYSSYGSSQFSYIAYGISSLPSQTTLQSLDKYVSYIYVTNLGGGNPYNGLPSYFMSEVAYLAGMTESSTTASSSPSSTHSTVSSTSTTTIASTSTTTTSFSTDPTQSQNTTLNVETVLASGQEIYGYYVALTQGDASVAWSYSPAAFTVQSGASYVVTPENYGNYAFSYWNDTDSTVASRIINVSSSTTLVAVYTYIGPSQVSITIKSVLLSGQSLTGMYVEVLSSSGQVVQQGYTELYFKATIGQSYSIVVANFEDFHFNHWNSGSKSSTLDITVSGATTYTAYYSTTSWWNRWAPN